MIKEKIVLTSLGHYDNGKLQFNSFPLGIGCVSAYAKKTLGINIPLFKHTEEFKNYVEKESPRIIGFSNYSWNSDLSLQFAKRIVKKKPNTITIFGGSDYPMELVSQLEYLKQRPEIDFYIVGEGEKAFVELIKALKKFKFNKTKLKRSGIKIPNCQYVYKGKLISGKLERVELDKMPLLYSSGVFDKFFKDSPIPMIQITRGCPYTCSYCISGDSYYSKIKRVSIKGVKKEIDHIAKKSKVSSLLIIDDNFGIFKEDVEICKLLMDYKSKKGFPNFIGGQLGKNSSTVIECIKILKDNMQIGLPVQSTDPEVLKSIERNNIDLKMAEKIIKTGKKYGTNTFSEIILGLPNDNYEKHERSILDMIDLGVKIVRSHQLVMVKCSKLNSKESRNKHKIKTAFRIQPKRFGIFEIYGKKFPVMESDEILISSKTMSNNDYLKSRRFDLTLELFYNNEIFIELNEFLIKKKVSISDFIKYLNSKIESSELNGFYDMFIEENKRSFIKNEEELNKHRNIKMIRRIIEDKIRDNEQLKYRAIAIFKKMDILHDFIFSVALNYLRDNRSYVKRDEEILENIKRFSLSKKEDLLNDSITKEEVFEFNILKGFCKEKIKLKFFHNKEQKKLIKESLDKFGDSINSLGQMLSWTPFNKFYRKYEVIKK